MKKQHSKKTIRAKSSSSSQLAQRSTATRLSSSSMANISVSAAYSTSQRSSMATSSTESRRMVSHTPSARASRQNATAHRKAFSTSSLSTGQAFSSISSPHQRTKLHEFSHQSMDANAHVAAAQPYTRQSQHSLSMPTQSHHQQQAVFMTPQAMNQRVSPLNGMVPPHSKVVRPVASAHHPGVGMAMTRGHGFTATPSSLSPLQQSIQTHQRMFATFKKVGKLEKPKAQEFVPKQKQDEAAESTRIPTLNDVMRTLYKKIHPDLMMNYPEQKEQNEKSLTILQSFLSGLKDTAGDEKYPMLRNASLIFFLRTNQPGHFQRVELLLHSDATLNRRVIEKQLLTFFSTIGIASKFKWDEEYFPLKRPPSFAKNEEQEQAEAEADQDQEGAHSNETYDEFMARIKRESKKQSA